MKRTQLTRSSPLRRTALKRSGKPWAIRGANKDWAKIRSAVLDREDGACQARFSPTCSGRADHAHHIIRRSQGGPDEAWNLLGVCGHPGGCHDRIHSEIALARERGFLRSGSELP